ncbi:hypothetical protein DERF_013237 [Dermatophagoides farinae]|uniref:Uncharacterized protein n=1 Tax=Dermatophagoides farinae TaxID=6954 RepID=A0A922KW30_DERFA|nr:hypothetical protein DERF_013237 [Dermatophagoides farinae]
MLYLVLYSNLSVEELVESKQYNNNNLTKKKEKKVQKNFKFPNTQIKKNFFLDECVKNPVLPNTMND